MAYEHATQRYRNWYANLLRLYPKPYRKRFGEGMEQTFNDLCLERRATENGLFGLVLWVFVETSAGIIRENITFMILQNKMRFAVWGVVIALMLWIPLQFQPFVQKADTVEAIAYGIILLILGGAYEIWQRLKPRSIAHRLVFVIGLVAVIFLSFVAVLALSEARTII